MTQEMVKPLNWQPTAGIGYHVTRRPDGGMHFTFSDLTPATLAHWRQFALDHLYDSDRLTRNLYDLRQVSSIPEQAIQYAVEVNSDPSVRNVRLAVVLSSPDALEALRQVADLTPGGVDMALFTSIVEAEAWLSRSLTQLV